MLTVGDKIKYFRKQRGMTQAQLAELTGIHPVSILSLIHICNSGKNVL